MRVFLVLFTVLWMTVFTGLVQAQEQTQAQQTSGQDMQELVRLLSNPDLVEKLKETLSNSGAVKDTPTVQGAPLETSVQAAILQVKARVRELEQAILGLAQFPAAFIAIRDTRMAAVDFLQTPIYVIIFLFGGFGLEWLYWAYLSGSLKRISQSRPDTYGALLKVLAVRGSLLFGSIAVFTFGSLGFFVSFKWSPNVADAVLTLLISLIIFRLVIILAAFILSPVTNGVRLLPISKVAAAKIFNWIIGICSAVLVGYLGVMALARAGLAPVFLTGVEFAVGAVVMILSIISIWQLTPDRPKGTGDGAATSKIARSVPGNFPAVLHSLPVFGVFVLWALQLDSLMWTLIILSLLFPAIRFSHLVVDHIFNHLEKPLPPVATEGDDESASEAPVGRFEFYRPLADRLVRFFLVIVAFLALGSVWDISEILNSVTPTFGQKALKLVVDIVFALLLAELLWTAIKTAIDQRLARIEPPIPGRAPGPEARIATLLPMIRKVLLVTILVMVILIILSSLGVNIGPLLAGAGVVGIALGFGAQALVKDIVSGVFFLIDDAFRVGEYIEMENLRGTVEAVSIRSLRVRHHRGALHTIPFGELKSLTNYSRDWVIMKLEFRVPFDTDIKLVKKIIKKVSANLQANEDYGQHIIQPLKSQGVRRMEEFNMVIGVKFMTVPGEQWTIRRDAYQQIRDAFEANGIHFASRNVTVEVVSDRPLTQEEQQAAVSAAQESIEQQIPGKPL